jgi:hypothetical protein
MSQNGSAAKTGKRGGPSLFALKVQMKFKCREIQWPIDPLSASRNERLLSHRNILHRGAAHQRIS